MVFDEGMAMKKKSKLFILVAGVLALALAPSACSTDEGSTDQAQERVSQLSFIQMIKKE